MQKRLIPALLAGLVAGPVCGSSQKKPSTDSTAEEFALSLAEAKRRMSAISTAVDELHAREAVRSPLRRTRSASVVTVRNTNLVNIRSAQQTAQQAVGRTRFLRGSSQRGGQATWRGGRRASRDHTRSRGRSKSRKRRGSKPSISPAASAAISTPRAIPGGGGRRRPALEKATSAQTLKFGSAPGPQSYADWRMLDEQLASPTSSNNPFVRTLAKAGVTLGDNDGTDQLTRDRRIAEWRANSEFTAIAFGKVLSGMGMEFESAGAVRLRSMRLELHRYLDSFVLSLRGSGPGGFMAQAARDKTDQFFASLDTFLDVIDVPFFKLSVVARLIAGAIQYTRQHFRERGDELRRSTIDPDTRRYFLQTLSYVGMMSEEALRFVAMEVRLEKPSVEPLAAALWAFYDQILEEDGYADMDEAERYDKAVEIPHRVLAMLLKPEEHLQRFPYQSKRSQGNKR